MTMNGVAETLGNLLIFFVLLGLMAFLLNLPNRPRRRMKRRLRELADDHGGFRTMQASEVPDILATSNTLKDRLMRRIVAFGEMLPLLDAKQRTKLGVQLTRAGFRDPNAVSVLVGIKLTSGACSAVVAALSASSVPFVADYFILHIVLMGTAFIVGIILPEPVLEFMIKRRQKQITTYFSDALDLLVICTNAGNSLPTSIKRVARELKMICAPLSDEFQYTADQMQVDGDTATALRDMSARIGVPSMRGLMTTLVQSQQYGTPISQSLITLSRSERHAQLMSLEERAAKLAPKMTIPMMLFILPTVAIISAGPAVLTLMDLFKNP